MIIVGRAGRPKGRNRNAHRASIVAAVGMGEQAVGKRELTYKERSELPDKNSEGNQGEFQEGGKVNPWTRKSRPHSFFGGRAHNYTGERHDYIHFEVCGKLSLVSQGIQGSETRMVKHNQGSQLPQQNNGQTNHFRCIVAQDRHIGFPFEYGQRQHGLPEEPLTQQEGLISLIEKK